MTDAEIRAALAAAVGDADAASLAGEVAGLPDPDGALRDLRRLVEVAPERPDAARARAFLVVASFSPYLGALLIRHPEFLRSLPGAIAPRTREDLEEDLARFEALNAAADPSSVLRRFRNREYPRIALPDFLGAADLPASMRALSLLADVLLDRAVRAAREPLEERHGRPLSRDAHGVVEEATFSVIALGKLGGEELNYSSDIDLLYLYSRDGETSGAGVDGGGVIGNKEFFTRLASAVTRLIGGAGPDGQVFRVDLGLRPGGNDGDLVTTSEAALSYYGAWADPWERQALIKARPAAGDLGLGGRFVEMARPLVYAVVPDPELESEVAAMKDRIDAQLRAAGTSERDVKLGRGGIREIEFAVQALQLRHGGRDPWLQQGNTLLALHRLTDKGFLTRSEHASLARAYVFLRDVEHRLQLGRNRQTALLPAGGEEWRLLARRLRLHETSPERESEALALALDHQRGVVRNFYDSVLGRAAQADLAAGVDDLWLDRLDDATLQRRLADAGVPDPTAALRAVRLIRRVLQQAPDTPALRRALRRGGAAILGAAGRSINAQRAFANLERFVSGLTADPEALVRFLSRRALVGATVRLLGKSDMLGGILIRQPSILDEAAERARVARTPEPAALRARLMEAVETEGDRRARAGALRRRQQAALAGIALRDINRQATVREVLKSLSDTADATLEAVLRLERPPKDEAPGDLRLAILGLGRLGYREIDYGSDLDLLFLCAGEGAHAGGVRTVARPWCERIVRALTTLSRDGQLYKVDLRLRPSGREGDLVSSFAALCDYFRGPAEVWEMLSFLKGRAVAGDLDVGQRTVDAVEAIIMDRARALGPRVIAEAVDSMRGRLLAERARDPDHAWDVKHGAGGLLDIHFTIEFLQLAHTVANPPDKDTLRLIAHLHDRGLFDKPTYATLYESYLFLRSLEHQMRLIQDRPRTSLPAESARLDELARAVDPEAGPGAASGPALRERFKAHVRSVEEVYRRVVRAGAA